MRLLRKWAANAIFVLHIALGIFFLAGWAFPAYQWVYLPLLISWPLSWIFLGYCPLTKWELLLRKKYDPKIDPNTEKIQYLCKKYLAIDVPSRPIFVGGMVVFLVLFMLSITPNVL